jgi:hypothetical protein
MHSYIEFEVAIRALEPQNAACPAEVQRLRHLLENALEAQSLTRHQWRVLWEDLAVIRSRCPDTEQHCWKTYS